MLSPLKAAAVMTSSRLHHASSLIALQESCLLCVLTSAQCANVLMEIMMHTLRRFLLQGFFFFFFFFSSHTHTKKKMTSSDLLDFSQLLADPFFEITRVV